MLRHLNFMKSNKSAAAVAVFFLYVMLVNLNIYKMALISKEHRTLAKDLGGGDCSIEPLADIEEAPGNATKTLLASYPGSGKRFTFSVIAGLTNHKVADDWDFSGLLDYSPLTVKTSWPHRAGIWSWENDMDQVILLIRNPRWAIPSYHTLRYEIDYANNWYSTFTRLDYVYTRRPNILVWEGWRDENFAEEIKNWSDYIDFWMQGGKYSDSPIQHPRCIVNKIDCKPKLVIDFDNFYKEHPGASFFKLGQTLDHLENIEGITALARTCVLDKVFTDKSLHNGNRDGMGPPPTAYRFTAAQHAVIETTMTALKDKYSQPPYDTDPVAQDLVFALNNYISENVGEKYLEEMMEMFYS